MMLGLVAHFAVLRAPTMRGPPLHGRRSVSDMASNDNNRANQLNPNNKEYWGSRNLGKHVTAFIPNDKAARRHLTTQWDEMVRVAAMGRDTDGGGSSHMLLFSDGGYASWGAPDALTLLLSTASNKRATYVVLSADDDRYYVGFDNESAKWRSRSDTLTEWIREEDVVSTLAFAPNGGFFVLFDSGTYGWEGLPTTLHNFLNSNCHRCAHIQHLSISDAGDWWVSFNDGKHPAWRSYGLPDQIDSRLAKSMAQNSLREIVLGANGAWLCRWSSPVRP